MPWKFFSSEGAELVTLKRPEMRTSLPATAQDGDEIILTDSLSAGTYHWHLRYVAARSSNKWVFIGGTDMSVGPSTGGTTASAASYTACGPASSSLLAGQYRFTIGGRAEASGGYPSDQLLLSFDAGGVTASDTDATSIYVGSGAGEDNIWNEKTVVKTVTAGTMQLKFKARSSTLLRIQYVYAHIRPIAIGG